MYNVQKLHRELEEAGIPIVGVSSDGRVDFKDEATKAQRAQVDEIKVKHDSTPDPTPKEQYATLTGLEEKVAFIARQLGLSDGE